MREPPPEPSPPETDRGPWLLALHSSSDTLGVGLQRLGGGEPPLLAAFPLGRGLANRLLACVESVLPAERWPHLGRLAVATGPGGFTGTRLTVVFARTLAQQLAIPLDGIGSFLLIARRLWAQGQAPAEGPFWLVQDLPRRGTVAGLYAAAPGVPGGVVELAVPRLFRPGVALGLAGEGDRGFSAPVPLPADPPPPACPRFPALPSLPEDVAGLLILSQAAAAAGTNAPWVSVVPIYPTSPVGEVGP